MQNLQKDLINLLAEEENLTVDNQLNKNKIIEAALKLEPSLINLLIKNATFKKYFFKELDNILVFDKIKFQRFVNNKSFLPDSYTAFKNKIGLTFNEETTDNYLNSNSDIVLAWPHKDCILEGGQTKDDQKRNEVFWNETLAPESVDRLLDAKIFTNFEKHDKNGKRSFNKFDKNENLVLKGNNLLIISSLLKTHREKIKLIYIDPPYNTGGAANTFAYNNSFNHSTWLTFMKNRLKIAKELLKKDGFISIAIDHFELFYLGVLCDEIFGIDNRIGVVSILHNPEGRQNAKFFTSTNEFMLVYAKDKEIAKFNKVYLQENFKESVDITEIFEFQDEISRYKKEPFIRLGGGNASLRKNKPNGFYPIYVSNDLKKISTNKIDENHHIIYPITISGQERTWKLVKESFEEKISSGNYFAEKNEDGKITIYEKYRILKGSPITTNWINKKYNSKTYGTNILEEILGSKIFSYPKSLNIVKDTIEIMTGKNDIVLDFFGGSGTTAQAVLDLNHEDDGNRKFIICEQMDYIENVTKNRIKKVIENNSSGSFIYAEMLKFNMYFIEKIRYTESKEDLISIWKEMQEKAFLSYRFNKDVFNKNLDAFKTTTLENMKHYLIEILDKNQLYVNFSEIEDVTFNISDENKNLNYSFYKK